MPERPVTIGRNTHFNRSFREEVLNAWLFNTIS